MTRAPTSFSSSILTTAVTYFILPAAFLFLLSPHMASLLRALVAGPRLKHEESDLDLCYVSSSSPCIIAMSVPAHSYPRKAYRNPVESVLAYLDRKHGPQNWRIWEFRAEGAGYEDSVFRNQIEHAPFPDHHPPPFEVIPRAMGSMRNWLAGDAGEWDKKDDQQKPERVIVVHCKAGKGRSGTMSCAYLISEHGYTAKQAMDQFTKYRMRPGFGEGVSIPSQVRYCHYVESWVRDHHKRYVDRSIRINELHVFGLRSGVKVAIQGYQDGGKVIKTFHTFHHDEKTIVARRTETGEELKLKSDAASTASSSSSSSDDDDPKKAKEKGGKDHEGVADVIFRPKNLLVVPNNDINIDFERRTKPKYGLALVTSIGHVWFNTYFEAAKRGEVDDSGVFEIEWGKMDGVKGTYKKGVKALDRLKVVWSVVEEEGEREVKEPELGEEVKLNTPAKNKKMVEEERGVGNVVESSGESSMTPAPNGETSSLDGAGGREQPYEAKVSRLGSIKREKGDNGKASSIH